MKRLNKKGFTLVELLAVIVILALLMVVATTSIGNVLNNSKKSAMDTELKKIITSVNTYLQQKNLNITDGGVVSGFLYDTGSVVCGKDGEYTYYISYANGLVSGSVRIMDNDKYGARANVTNGSAVSYTGSGNFERSVLTSTSSITATSTSCASSTFAK